MVKSEKPKYNFVRKTISISKEQEKYIEENCINLSRLVQKKLNEVIEKE